MTALDKIQVILIDDDSISNLINSKMVNKYKHDVDLSVFLKAKDALVKMPDLIKGQTTVIFLDINMPEMNGWEFLDSFVKQNVTNCKVYMLTSSINENDKNKAAQYAVVHDFISKPLSFEKLAAIF